MLLLPAVHMKTDVSSCANNRKESLREKFKPLLLSHLHTADQSLREAGVNQIVVFEKKKIVGRRSSDSNFGKVLKHIDTLHLTIFVTFWNQ